MHIENTVTEEKTLNCRKCLEPKPMTPKFFYPSSYKNNGDKICIECQKKKPRSSRAKYQREARRNNKEIFKQYNKTYNLRHKEERAIKHKIYLEKTADARRAYRKARNQRLRKDPYNRLVQNLRVRTYSAFKYGQGQKMEKTEELLGCKFLFAKKHIESLWTEGMTWDNYKLYGWSVDHIIPCDSFDLRKLSEQKKCFHWTNLQPLWWVDNIRKSNKV